MTDARGRAGRDEVARLERHELTDVCHELLHREHHVRGVAVLPALAVHRGPQREGLWIADLVAGHEPGPDGTERVAALALGCRALALHLKRALGHVVDDRVP